MLWVGLGSSNKPLQKNNPFSAEERKIMLLSSIDESMKSRIQIYFIPDLENHAEWIKLIDKLVPKFDIIFTNDELTKHLYSKQNIEVLSIPLVNRDILSGTNIRDMIVSDLKWDDYVPEGTKNFLNKINAKKRLKIL